MESRTHSLPDEDTCRLILSKMMLIRRFEERAGEMYAKAKIGGFLHLSIGEEATIVGATQALRETDYLMSTYREHGQALARGTHPNAVMAELFGREDGTSGGRGGSMHLFDGERRFLGGYGIVGGTLPLSAGVALAADYQGTEDVILSMMGDGATNQGTFGETMNLAALWKLPVVFLIINNQFGMGTALHRHSAVTDLSRKSEGFGVPGTKCDGMDVLDVHSVVTDALALRARGAQAAARGGGDLPLPRPLHGRPRGVPHQGGGRGVAQARPDRLLLQAARGRGRAQATRTWRRSTRRPSRPIDEAVKFADDSPFPDLDSLYDHVYIYGGDVPGWWTVDERSPEPHRGEREREAGALPHELAEKGAAYASVGDAQERRRRPPRTPTAGADEGEGEPAPGSREEEGGAD